MTITILLCSISLIASIITIMLVIKNNKAISSQQDDLLIMINSVKNDLLGEIRSSRTEITNTVTNIISTTNDAVGNNQRHIGEIMEKRLVETGISMNQSQSVLIKAVNDRLSGIDVRFNSFSKQNEQSLEAIRTSVQTSLQKIGEDNEKKLEEMRLTVDEKLQKTLDTRISESFKLVNDRLQEVYVGLGEMKNLASGVGDLKKVLSNVKTRGIMGEYQLAAILEEILSKDQYDENIITKPSTSNRVEFAIKLPGDDKNHVYLPIDAKFPGDTYNALVDAYESGDQSKINEAVSALETRIKGCAKDIRDKYIDPPYTTDFAIMFLPFEGLYAEVVRRGLVDILQRQYKVNIAGPTTLAALLNSLQMGFRTLAIQKRSSEVWDVLGAVKTEFNTFNDVLSAAQKRIEQTHEELDKLVGVRTRKINSKLRQVSELSADDTKRLLDCED